MQIGTGWFGYTPEQVLNMDMSDLLLAREGRIEYLILTGVLRERDEEVGMGPVFTPEDFDRRARSLDA